jgi:putative FmdB family regulatory protein
LHLARTKLITMPIYAYKCDSCGFAKDALQKISDAPLTQCPSCGAASFTKQVTAAGFQLKGTGWYATDFKGGGAATTTPSEGKSSAGDDAKSDTKPATTSDAPAKKPDAAPAASS